VTDPDRWALVKAIFDEVVSTYAGERAALVRQRCGHDPLLQSDVDSLLAADGRHGAVFDAGVVAAAGARALAVAGHAVQGEVPGLSPGDRFGRYVIIGRLGAGGMGAVYRAQDTVLDRKVAIKVLPAHWMTEVEHRRRFEREARLLAALNHPNIGAIYGIEDALSGSAGTACLRGLVLELVDGMTLAERIGAARTGRAGGTRGLPVATALHIAFQIAGALDAAHERGIAHRDLKPSNIGLTSEGRVKVLDFGIAGTVSDYRDSGTSRSGQVPAEGTGGGAVFGTARYMSPSRRAASR
jgi:eukaryotic-like serine/threonine-protein kinase